MEWLKKDWWDFASKSSTVTWKKTEQTFHGQSAMFYLKTKRRDYILLIPVEKKKMHSIISDITVFRGWLLQWWSAGLIYIFSSIFQLPLKSKNLHLLFNSVLFNSACNWQKLLLVSFHLLHSNSLSLTWVYSTTVSCPKWHLAGPDSQLLAGETPWTATVQMVTAWCAF